MNLWWKNHEDVQKKRCESSRKKHLKFEIFFGVKIAKRLSVLFVKVDAFFMCWNEDFKLIILRNSVKYGLLTFIHFNFFWQCTDVSILFYLTFQNFLFQKSQILRWKISKYSTISPQKTSKILTFSLKNDSSFPIFNIFFTL